MKWHYALGHISNLEIKKSNFDAAQSSERKWKYNNEKKIVTVSNPDANGMWMRDMQNPMPQGVG